MSILNPEEFLEKAKKIELKKNKRTLYTILLTLILALVYLIVSFFTVKEKTEELKVIKKEKVQLEIHTKKEDSAKITINNFFKYQNSADTAGIKSLLADTLLRYYLRTKKISKNKLLKMVDFELPQNARYEIDSSFNTTNINDTAISLVKTTVIEFNKHTEILFHEFKLNKNYQIIYVRAFTAKPMK